MTRDELIKAINDNDERWSCPEYSCDKPEEEGNTGECCLKCAESQLDQYEQEIRKEAVLWVRKLIKIFWKDWNMQSTKKLSKFAFDELDEFIMQQADESNGRIFMEQIKQIEGFYGLKGE